VISSDFSAQQNILIYFIIGIGPKVKILIFCPEKHNLDQKVWITTKFSMIVSLHPNSQVCSHHISHIGVSLEFNIHLLNIGYYHADHWFHIQICTSWISQRTQSSTWFLHKFSQFISDWKLISFQNFLLHHRSPGTFCIDVLLCYIITLFTEFLHNSNKRLM